MGKAANGIKIQPADFPVETIVEEGQDAGREVTKAMVCYTATAVRTIVTSLQSYG